MENKYFKKNKLPDKPGVYFFLKNKEIIYIGKATSLKDRVKSYFGKDLIETRGPIILDMVFKADKIKWQITDSVLEAIILEANLIKKHQPKYNTKEKSDKSFNYVCITKPARNASHSDAGGEKLPKVLIMRGRNLQRKLVNSLRFTLKGSDTQKNLLISFASVFGPYTNSPQLREAIKIIRRIFPFLDDKSKNYMEFYKQINLVPDLNDRKLYMQNIRNIKLFFSGKKQQILKNLKKEMDRYSKMCEFEKAGEIKRQIFALQHINDIALLKSETKNYENYSRLTRQNPTGSDTDKNFHNSLFRIESYDIAHMGGKNMVGVMTVVENGEVAKHEYKKFKIRTQNNANDTGALTEVLERRLAHKEWIYPSLIVVDGGIAQINSAKTILSRFNLDIPIVSVVKDEHHKPKNIIGKKELVLRYKMAILLANSEAHRFAIAYHKNLRAKNFLK